MGQAINSLHRVLDLEIEQGYQDKAVVGGIRQFAAFWVSKAREQTVDEADKALIEQIAEILMGYSRLPGVEARAEAVDLLKNKLKQREERLKSEEETVKAPPAAKPPAPPATAEPVESVKPLSAAKPPAPPATAEPDEAVKPAPPADSPPVAKREPPAESEAPRSAPAVTAVIDQKPKPPSKPMVEPELAEPDPDGLGQPVTELRGVGQRTGQNLATLGAETILDLLYIFPRRYDDYTLLKPIGQLNFGETVTVIGTVWETRLRRTRGHQLVQSVVSDGTGNIDVTWFNQPWLADKISAGSQIVLSGKVDQFLGRPVFQNPEWEPLEMEPLRTRRIVPIYPLTKGLTAHRMREIMKQASDVWAPRLPEPLPEVIRDRRNLYRLPFAVRQAHFPESQESMHKARRRLIFDELFLLQLGMLGLRREWQTSPGLRIPTELDALKQFIRTLPYQLTDAQKRVIREIAADIAQPTPMNRLLQGDVGSGKTAVAAAAMVLVVRAGFQTALMAPTEILAEQHYRGLGQMLGEIGIDVHLVTGSTAPKEKKRLYKMLADGSVNVVIGTHALIQEGVDFNNLGLAIIDEQHRFGVDQRKALRDKGFVATGESENVNPHLLVMSATPIPRTLALSLYGDLDLSIIDEMPPGREEIKTRWLRPGARERAYSFVDSQIQEGRQAFIICPLVEESENIEAKAAVEEYERLQKHIFPNLKLGLLHGRLKSDEKEATMRAFHEGQTDILVATSVIEVGIDVPNSTVMLIEGANRFGLAQLHQFRGRVGRGEHQSYCLLLADDISGDAEERLVAMEKTNDGFLLAEKDLDLRGPGEFFGRRQSGLPELVLASLTDIEMLEIARHEAQEIFKLDPNLDQPEHLLLREKLADFWQDAGDVS
jgi:ATP-dependent DNA helicase RecG